MSTKAGLDYDHYVEEIIMNLPQYQKRKLLLIPSIPTPNGRLHLGHIGGPFLKMDILKRFNIQLNNRVFLYGGTDCHDSYVLLKAFLDNKTPEDISGQYYKSILEDLKKMSIEFDFFLNPLNTDFMSEYQLLTHQLAYKLIELKKACQVEESYPFVAKIGYLPPSFIKGKCPSCQIEMSGFICETCGLTYKPQDIIDKNTKIGNLNIENKTVKSFFSKINSRQILANLENLNDDALSIIKNYIRYSQEIRLTVPTNWGVATAFNSVYYNYGTFFGYCILLGEICKQNNKLDLNPFFERSETITVASFGFDNIVTFMINTYNHALSIPGYKSFDYYLPNKFLTLNGQKFSTSRNHAVWVEKLPNSISIDIIRLFLLKQNADSKSNDFDIYQFSTFYNAIASDINSKVIGKLSFIYQKKIVIPDEIRNYFFDLMNARLSYSMPENYDASKICANIQEWLRYSENISNGNYYWWLKAFSILSFSVMPNLAVVLWQVLGGQEVPKLINFLDYTRPIPNANITPFELISPSKIVLG